MKHEKVRLKRKIPYGKTITYLATPFFFIRNKHNAMKITKSDAVATINNSQYHVKANVMQPRSMLAMGSEMSRSNMKVGTQMNDTE